MSERDVLRRAALRCALARDPGSFDRRAGRHPDANALRADPPFEVELSELLWTELESLEEARRLGVAGPASRGGPADFFSRRRRVDQVRAVDSVADALPSPWSRLVRLPAVTIAAGTVELGVRMIAGIMVGEERHRVVQQLEPLGTGLAARVVTARDRPAPRLEPMLAGAWRLAFQRDAEERTRSTLAGWMGRRLVATLYRRLPAESRRAAAHVSRTNIFKKLEVAPALPLPRGADAEIALALVVGVFGGDVETDPEPEGVR